MVLILLAGIAGCALMPLAALPQDGRFSLRPVTAGDLQGPHFTS
jgi:hypothetical protein